MNYPTCPRKDGGALSPIMARPNDRPPATFGEYRGGVVGWLCDQGHELESGEEPILPTEP